MITLKTSVGIFGPFSVAYKEADAWNCDGVIYPESVVGAGDLVLGDPDISPVVMPAVPSQVSMLAARTVLYKENLLQLVEDLIAVMPGELGDLARIKWAAALTVRRDDDLVTQVIPQLGKTEGEIDAMFIAADLIDRAA